MGGFFDFISAVKDTEASVDGNIGIEMRLDPRKAAQIMSRWDDKNLHKDGKALIYPQDLFTRSQEAYIFFVIRDSVMQQTTVLKRIGLYLPGSIKVNYGTQWEEMQMTVNQYLDTAKDAAQIADLQKSFDSMKSGYDSGGIQGAFGGLVNTPAGMIAARGTANAVDATFGSNFGQQLEKYTGTTVNPHMAMLFKGVNFREFQFSFELMARTAKESNNIRKIIKCFKAAMHPGNNSELGARYWTYPYNFDIYLASPSTKYMFNIATSVLTQMSVDYNGSGFPSFFTTTGAPVQINMTLNFKELEVLTRERVLQDY